MKEIGRTIFDVCGTEAKVHETHVSAEEAYTRCYTMYTDLKNRLALRGEPKAIPWEDFSPREYESFLQEKERYDQALRCLKTALRHRGGRQSRRKFLALIENLRPTSCVCGR